MKHVKLFEELNNDKFDENTQPPFDKLQGYKTIKQEDVGIGEIYDIYHREIGYGGDYDMLLVASYNKTKNTLRPTHGYWKPHKTGKYLAKKAEEFGIEWVQ